MEETKDSNDLCILVDFVDEDVCSHDCFSVSQFGKLRVGTERKE